MRTQTKEKKRIRHKLLYQLSGKGRIVLRSQKTFYVKIHERKSFTVWSPSFTIWSPQMFLLLSTLGLVTHSAHPARSPMSSNPSAVLLTSEVLERDEDTDDERVSSDARSSDLALFSGG